MTLNDIKIAALELMFTNYSDDLRDQDVDDITSEEYTQYLVNMDQSINRALGRIESAGVLAPRKIVLTRENGEVGDYFTRYSIPELASDIMSVTRIAKENGTDYQQSVDWKTEADEIVIPTLGEGEKYVLIYSRRVRRVLPGAESSTVIDLPQHLAEIIPYFIKADLYEEDEPKLATQARNIFEAFLQTYVYNDEGASGGVKNIWGSLQ